MCIESTWGDGVWIVVGKKVGILIFSHSSRATSPKVLILPEGISYVTILGPPRSQLQFFPQCLHTKTFNLPCCMEPTFLNFHLTATKKDHGLLSTAGEDPSTSHNLHDVLETPLLCWYQSATEVPTPTQPSRMSKWDIIMSAISPWDLLLATVYPNSSCFSITAMLSRKVNGSLMGIPQAELL